MHIVCYFFAVAYIIRIDVEVIVFNNNDRNNMQLRETYFN